MTTLAGKGVRRVANDAVGPFFAMCSTTMESSLLARAVDSWNEKRRVNIPKRTDITLSAAERGQRREIRMEFQRPVRDQS